MVKQQLSPSFKYKYLSLGENIDVVERTPFRSALK